MCQKWKKTPSFEPLGLTSCMPVGIGKVVQYLLKEWCWWFLNSNAHKCSQGFQRMKENNIVF